MNGILLKWSKYWNTKSIESSDNCEKKMVKPDDFEEIGCSSGITIGQIEIPEEHCTGKM